MKTLRIAWWLANYTFTWWLPCICIFGTIVLTCLFVPKQEKRSLAEPKYSLYAIDLRTSASKTPPKEIPGTSLSVGLPADTEMAQKLLSGNGIDGIITLRDSFIRLDYLEIIGRPGQTTEGLIAAARQIVETAGGDTSKMSERSAINVPALANAPEMWGGFLVLAAYISFTAFLVLGSLNSFSSMRGDPTTEVLISGLGPHALLQVAVLELIIRAARFWLITAATIIAIKALSLGIISANIMLVTMVSKAPLWVIAMGVVTGIPYGVLAVSIAASLGSIGGRLFAWLKNIFILGTTVATFLGAFAGGLEDLEKVFPTEFVKLGIDEWIPQVASICPFTSGSFMITKMVLTGHVPVMWLPSVIITTVAAVWCYCAAMRIFPPSIVDASLKCHWRRFVDNLIWPFRR